MDYHSASFGYPTDVFYSHHCLEHGEYREELPASDADSCSSSADQAHTSQPGSDDEDPSQINHRLVIRPRFSDHTKAVSLAYRWSNLPQRSTLISEQARDLVDFPGLDADDSGEDELLSFESSGCSERCFWIVLSPPLLLVHDPVLTSV